MLAYSHIGDVLGSPNLPSLGDSAGAMKAYRQITDVARRLYETDRADQRATRDYAVALARVAGGLPADRPAQRVPLLRESARLLQEVAMINPENLTNRADLAHGYGLLGDALDASGDPAGAVRAYRESVVLAETMLQAGQSVPQVALVSSCRKLGQEAARRGDRDTGLSYARRALEVSDPTAALAKNRPANIQRFLTPRGSATMGLVYANLAGSNHTTSEQVREDRRQAVLWLEKSLAAWRQVESDPAFAPPHRKELRQVEAALAALTKKR
jgi:hypothetical protein